MDFARRITCRKPSGSGKINRAGQPVSGPQAVEKVRWTFSTACTMPRFSAREAGRKAAAARRKRLLTQAFCRHSIQHEGAPGHRCGFAIPGPFWAANRAASSKPARFFRRWRRFAAFLFPTKPASLGFCGVPLSVEKENAPFDGVREKGSGGGIPGFARNARGACYEGFGLVVAVGFTSSVFS